MTVLTGDHDDRGEAFIPRYGNPRRFGAILRHAAGWYGEKGQTMTDQQPTPGVPEFIPRQRYVDLVAACGLDPADVVRLDCGVHEVTATVWVRDDQGHMVSGTDGSGTPLQRSFRIPVR